MSRRRRVGWAPMPTAPARGYQRAPRPPAAAFTGEAPPVDLRGRVERSPAAAQEIRLPLQFANGSTIALATIPIGVGLRTVALACETASLSYAAFQIVGLDCIVDVSSDTNGQIGTREDILLSLLVNTYNAQGDVQLLYGAPQWVGFVSQTRHGEGFERNDVVGGPGVRHTVPGVRVNTIVGPSDRIELTATLRQEIDNQQPINVSLQFAAVVRTLWDRRANVPGRSRVP